MSFPSIFDGLSAEEKELFDKLALCTSVYEMQQIRAAYKARGVELAPPVQFTVVWNHPNGEIEIEDR